MKIFITGLILIGLLFVLAGCNGEPVQDEPDPPAPGFMSDLRDTRDGIGDGLSEAWDHVSDFGADRADEFIDAIQGASEKIQGRGEMLIEESDNISDDAAERFHRARENVSEQLGKAKDASEENWEKAREGVINAMDNLKQEYENLRD